MEQSGTAHASTISCEPRARVPASGLTTTLLLGAGAGASTAASDTDGAPATETGVPIVAALAPVNGLRMYHEIHGRADGVPLVLLHGGGSTIETTWGRILPHLRRTRGVVAVEEQGHGRTSDRDAPFRFDTSADDAAALLRHLGIEQADLFGFSNGASVALQVAIRHPTLVRRLVFASAMTRRDGAHPWLWELIAGAELATMPQPLQQGFLRVNPDPVKLRNMHDKDAERMRNFPDVPDGALRALRARTLVLAGDRDVVRPAHLVEIAGLIPEARLLVLPAGHGDYLGEASAAAAGAADPELVARLVEGFLAEP